MSEIVTHDNVDYVMKQKIPITRGPDWKYGDQDIHKGQKMIGFITGYSKYHGFDVEVTWFHNNREIESYLYNIGKDDFYDLKILEMKNQFKLTNI